MNNLKCKLLKALLGVSLGAKAIIASGNDPVSYTHLTLPTKLEV